MPESFFIAISAQKDLVCIDETHFNDVHAVPRRFEGNIYMGPVFDKVFSFTYEVKLPQGKEHLCNLEVGDKKLHQKLNLDRVLFLVSENHLLGHTEPSDNFLILHFTCLDDEAIPKLKGKGLVDPDIVRGYLAAIADRLPNLKDLLGVFDVPRPGLLHGENVVSTNENAEHVKPYLFAFYYYAHLIGWRIERSQVDLNLVVMNMPTQKLVESINIQRLRIINLHRYFLTNNRSSNPLIGEFCTQRIAAHKIKEKYQRYMTTLIEIENYTNNLNMYAQTRGSKSVKATLNILAFTAIPLGIFGTITQISIENDWFTSGGNIIFNAKVLFWLGVSFVMPVLLITLSFFLDKYVLRIIKK